MQDATTLLLNRADTASLLCISECIAAVEKTFGLFATGKISPPKMLGIHVDGGGFHIKTGVSERYFVAKINANFPKNPNQNGLPTIQGVIVVFDITNGRLLSLMDSIEITIIRTGAATAVAANYLSLPSASVVTICGCGNQGTISLRALMEVRSLDKVFAFDIDTLRAENMAAKFANKIKLEVITSDQLREALRQSQICVACTPSKEPFIRPEYIMPGTFIAAVGSDSEEKQELYPELLVNNKIVTDVTEQCALIGELHHALRHKIVTVDCVHAELGQIIAGIKRGRESDQEIIVFDSTGTALQDVASAAIVYEKALAGKIGSGLDFSNQQGLDPLENNGGAIDILKSFYPFR